MPGVSLLLIALWTLPVLAANAGKVLMASGDTSRVAVDGVRSALQAGDAVFSGDTLLTGVDSRLQWRTNDGGMFALRPNTEFKVDEYQYDAGKSTGRSFFSLAKGGFRTLSGRIGKKRHDDYQVKTPVATLGIRGTHYIVQLCLAGAGAADATCGVAAPGLYLGTIAGAVLLASRVDSLLVNANQSAFVGSLVSPPELLRVTPGMLKDTVLPRRRGATGPPPRVVTPRGGEPVGPVVLSPPPRLPTMAAGSGEVADLSTGSLPPATAMAEPAPEPPPPEPADKAVVDATPEAGKPPVEAPGPTPIGFVPLPAVVDPGTHVTAVASGPIGPTPLHTNIGTEPVLNIADVEKEPSLGFSDLYDIAAPASVVDRGEDPDTGIYWGRIINGAFNVPGVDANGNQTPTDPFDNRSLHYVSGTSRDGVSLPMTGTADYALVGNTSPTDNFGSTGTLSSASLVADFTNQKVLVSLAVGLNSSTWVVDGAQVSLNGSGGDFGGTVPVEISSTGSSIPLTGSGEVAGFFSGTPVNSTSPPPGAGLGYSLFDGDQQVISGAVAFRAQ